MSDSHNPDPEGGKKRSKLMLLVSLALAVVGAGAGFAAVSTGLLPLGAGGGKEEQRKPEKASLDASGISYVEIQPIMVSFHAPGQAHQLKFRAQLEVNALDKTDVARLTPRITDMMNGYLRALTLEELKDPLALIRIRSHLHSRIDILVGKAAVRDVLIMEFVLN